MDIPVFPLHEGEVIPEHQSLGELYPPIDVNALTESEKQEYFESLLDNI